MPHHRVDRLLHQQAEASHLQKEMGKAVPKYEGDIYKPEKLFEFIEKLEAYFEVAELSDYNLWRMFGGLLKEVKESARVHGRTLR